MKFCDKLPKLRKQNNLSQELLADKLGVSRQAVSKWEQGSSYPDMEKMIAMCKILNCTLEDLLDDGAIGNNTNNSNSNKFNFTNYLNDFLKFITRMYNMFLAMSFKDKIKCILEMIFIGVILLIVSIIIYEILSELLFDIFLSIPAVGYYINYTIEKIFIAVLIVASLIIFIHLFKIRYLDYYVTVEDQNAKEKAFEAPVEDKKIINQKKERIIIRDPKHSKFSFFDLLAKIVIFILKIMFVIFGVPCLITFILIISTIAMSIYHIKFGIIFLFIAIALIGLILLNYIVIEFIYKFIISEKQNYKKIFIILISGLAIFAIGVGLSICTYLTFEKTNDVPKEFTQTNTTEIKMTDKTVIENQNIIYKIDNNVDNIILTSKSTIYDDMSHEIYKSNTYNVWYINSYYDDYEILKLLYTDIKNKKTRDYIDFMPTNMITATVSKENYDKLMKNYLNYINDYNNYYNDSENY